MAHMTKAIPPTSSRAVTTTSDHCSGKTAGRRGAKVLRRRLRHMATVWVLMQDAFGIVLFVVVAVAIVVAAIAISGTGKLYRQIGRGGLSLDRASDHVRPGRSGGATSRAEAEAGIPP